MTAISVRSLVKRYREFEAVRSISFDVDDGELVGFVGPNGAGKTSTLRIMVGLSHPTSGEVLLDGERVVTGQGRALAHVGYMPDDPDFAPWMSPLEHLRFVGGFYPGNAREVDERARELVRFVGLERHRDRRVEGFSKGERQRLALAHAIVGRPSLLLMDEPTSGLDPLGRRELLDFIKGLEGEMTILFSTHLLVDVERVCGRVVMIDKGVIIADDTVDGLKAGFGGMVLGLEVEGATAPLLEAVGRLTWCAGAREAGGRVELEVSDRAAAARDIPRIVAELGLGLVRLDDRGPSLEEVFAGLIGENPQDEVRSL